MNKFILFTICYIIPCLLIAQEKEWRAGIFLGGMTYEGDVVESTIFNPNELGLTGGLYIEKKLRSVLGIRASVIAGKVTGDDSNYEEPTWRPLRDFEFETRLTEVSMQLHWNILGRKRYVDTTGQFKKQLSPYLFGGMGVVFANPIVNFDNNSLVSLADRILLDKNHDGKNIHLVIPFGGGLKLDLNRRVQIGIEVGLRPTFSDYIDGISEAANPDKNDWYVFGGVSLGVELGDRDQDDDGISDEEDLCPEVKGLTTMLGCPDSDEDGVADHEDLCPETKGLKHFSGCPDRDQDGITDLEDDCPTIAGIFYFKGCPDTDGDGLKDSEDECPTVAGNARYKGCPPIDTDKDGIIDLEDACPEVAGVPERNGCPKPIDSDKDGIVDSEDRCPNSKGIAANEGCPALTDSDGDGVADRDDRCPNLAGLAELVGCPEAKELTQEDQAVLIYAMENVQFETGSNRLKSASYIVLDQIIQLMKEKPMQKLSINGYTDSIGKANTNQILSEKRAKACYDYFLEKGFPARRLTYRGFGEQNPIASNATAEGRAQNRRVEFELK